MTLGNERESILHRLSGIRCIERYGIDMKDRQQIVIILAIVILVIIIGAAFAITGPSQVPGPARNTTGAGIPNPAAEFCSSQAGNRYEIRAAPDGSQYGVCILPDGTVCDEWDYFRGNCTAATDSAQPVTDPAENFCLARSYMYQTRTGVNGTEYAFCIFPNGNECDAWSYYLGKCNETTGEPA